MDRRRVHLWYDPEVDILEIIWADGEGTFASTDDDRILERIDDDGNALGFMIHDFSTLDATSWVSFDIGGEPKPGIVNVTAKMAVESIGVLYSRMRQLLAEGRVKGAERLGRDWVIPLPVEITPGTRGPVGVAGERPTRSSPGMSS